MKRRFSLTFLRHHRFELFLSLLLLVSSIPYVTRQSLPPMSIEALLPDAVRYTWGLALLIGSSSVIIGLVLRRPKVEYIGLLTLAWPAIVYSTLVIIFNTNAGQGGRAGYPAVLAFVMALFCLDRAWELWKLSHKQ